MSALFPGPIVADEALARFVMFQDWVRADRTVRPDAFIPPKDLQLSMTRHIGLSESRIWEIGEMVATERDVDLIGRADVAVRNIASVGLSVQPAPIPENPNHAHVTGWPEDKPSKKILAQQLAAVAAYVPKP